MRFRSLFFALAVALPLVASAQTRTQQASDDFDAYEGSTDLGSVSGGNWATLHPNWGGPGVDDAAGQIVGQTTGGEGVARWTGAGSWTDDQYSSLEIQSGAFAFNGTSYQIGVLVRASDGTDATRDYYALYVSDTANGDPASRLTTLVRVVNGSATTLASDDVSWGTGDRVELEVEGSGTSTTVRGMQDGVVIEGFEIVDDSGSALETGLPGVWMRGGSAFPKGDNWQGGTLSEDTGGGVTNVLTLQQLSKAYGPHRSQQLGGLLQ